MLRHWRRAKVISFTAAMVFVCVVISGNVYDLPVTDSSLLVFSVDSFIHSFVDSFISLYEFWLNCTCIDFYQFQEFFS